MRVALALSVLTVFACSNTNPAVTNPGVGDPIGTNPGQLPDGGQADAGSDAGTTSDAGTDCNVAGVPLNTILIANDTCASIATTTASINQNATPCNVTITVFDGLICSGSLAGASNAFSGTCNSLICSSGSLPGTITCTLPGGQLCTAQICDVNGICR
ncbi:MAG TPA: hypothetical protein VFE76_04375 [Myxococcales bacterium]|nr:hypothetical protein [Myxococcales bacterium]